jgi:hypothetical protein
MARLARLVGRGRAAEILLGADDVPAELAERYGYVNRVLPDTGLAGFVDSFARRIAGFDKAAVAGTKALLDWASLPPDEEFGPGLAAFFRTSGRPENGARVRYLFENGLQTPAGAELHLGRAVGDFASSLDVARPRCGKLRSRQDEVTESREEMRDGQPGRIQGQGGPHHRRLWRHRPGRRGTAR